MKNYNDIGELYREKFADYTPEPPASVWEGLELTAKKQVSLWKKLTYPFAGTVLIGAVIYLIIANPKPQESAIAMVDNNQENVENLIVSNEVLVDENLVVSTPKQEKQVLHTFHLPVLTQDVELTDFSIDFGEETPKIVEKQIVSDKNVSDEQNQKQNSVNQIHNENLPTKIVPVKISKDTTVCENSTVRLYAYNAENIRWSTGETKNAITVYPSYSEQYSVTFSTTNAKDTTVYIYVNVIQCTKVLIPNAFTPNGDGLNDVFLAQTNIELKSFEMTIYSADGRQILFNSKDINRGWDGTYKGQPQPHGRYLYTIRYTDNLGKTIEKPGELLLILQ